MPDADVVFRQAQIVSPWGVRPGDVAVRAGKISAITLPGEGPLAARTVDAAGKVDAWQTLLNRRQGEALNAEQSVAARSLWEASAGKLLETAELASRVPSPENLFAFRKMLATHYTVQKEVIAARTETARALQSWRIPVGGQREMMAGIEDAIRRAKAYEATGVDALFFTGIKSRAELEAIVSATRLPIVLGGAPDELNAIDYLASQRVRIALQGHAPIAAATQAVYDVQKALREGTAPKALKGLPSPELTNRVTREAEVKARSVDLLGLKK